MPILCGSLCALGGCLEVGLVFYSSEEPPISIQINKLELTWFWFSTLVELGIQFSVDPELFGYFFITLLNL
jgi:hypothetical protein